MTDLRTAAQQALEALLTYEQYIQPLTNYFGGPRVPKEGSASAKVDAAITTLRAALAEPDYWQEEARRYAGNADYWRNRYEALAEPMQEPVAWMVYTEGGTSAYVTDNPNDLVGAYRALALYTALPQRKPLTDEEIRDLWSWAMTAEAERTATTQQHAFARAIERAHGIGGQDEP